MGDGGVGPVTAGNVQMSQCQTKKMVYQCANFIVSCVTAESSRSNLDRANWFQKPNQLCVSLCFVSFFFNLWLLCGLAPGQGSEFSFYRDAEIIS